MNSDIHIISVGRVESTMHEARSRIGNPEFDLPFVVIADEQTAAIGRNGATWSSEIDTGLYATFATEFDVPTAHRGLIAIGVGVAICDLLADRAIDARLKWPNDVLVGDRKLAGVLIQIFGDPKPVALIGVGLNLLTSSVISRENGIALEEVFQPVPERTDLVRRLAQRIGVWMNLLESGDFDAIIDAWIGYAAWLGEPVSVLTDSRIEGTLAGIDEHGRLLIAQGDTLTAVASGDVRRGPRLTPDSYTNRDGAQ